MINIRGTAHKVRAASLRRAGMLKVEALEDRFLLATRTWSGLGADANWATGANWVGNIAPVAGDDLIFPSGAARLANINNLAAGLSINSLAFTGGGYLITGNALSLAGNITDDPTGGGSTTNTLELDLVLPAVRTITVGAGTFVLRGVLSGAGGITKAGTATLELNGSAANTYTGATLVSGGTLLLNKTAGVIAVPGALTVGDGAGTRETLRLQANNQIAAAVVPILNGGLVELGAFTQTVAGLTLTDGQVTATTGTLTLNGNVTVNAASASSSLGGNLALGTAARTFTVADGAAADDLLVAGVVSGSGELLKAGAGRLVLSAANTYTGATTVQAGTLNLRHAAALGATSAGTTVASQAVLELQGGIAVGTEALTFQALAGQPAGSLRNVSDTNSWAGNITVAEDAVFDVAAGQLTLSGVLAGGAAGRTLTKRGTGTLVYTGTTANTYAGATAVAEGVLQLNKTAGTNALAGNLIVGDGTGNAGSDIVRLLAADQIADAAAVQVGTSGLLDLNGQSETVGPLTLTGGSITTGAGTLTLTGNVTTNAAANAATISGNLALGGATRTFTLADGAAAEDLVLAAGVSGAAGAGLTKEGPGTLRLNAANTYAGPTTVTAGRLLINGTQAGSSVTVATGATLGGSGTVGAVTANGTLEPGDGPGILRAGNVTFASTGTYRVELNGTAVGTGYDQLLVTGTVALGNATLNATLGFSSTGGTQYIILSNDGTDAVTGTFNGLAEGASVTLGGRNFTISYRGGDGNDVVLTDASTPTTTTLTSSAANSVFGQSVTFTAVVAPSTGTGAPTGTVTFRDGTTTLGTGTLTNGRATFTTTTLAVGSRQITAVYAGDTTFGGSTSAPLTQTVAKAATTSTVTATPNPATPGQAVLFTATVQATAPGVGTPTGTVTFRDGGTVLGTAPLTPLGTATFTTSTLSSGARTITVTYAGDDNFTASTSSEITVTVRSPLPPNQRYVAQLYTDLLQRNVEESGLAFWSGQLDRGVSRQDVALAITRSVEYRTILVRGLYQRYLGRAADSGGLNAFVSFLGSGGTVEQAAAGMIGSAEYFARAGSTNTGWLTAAYRDALGRTPDASGQAAHLAGLAAGATRQRIAEVIFTSNEGHEGDVRRFYQSFLRREAEPGGLNLFASALNRGTRQEQVIAAILSSSEYFNRV